MISAFKNGPTRPVWEVEDNDGSAALLSASVQRTEIASERKDELERRIVQVTSFIDALTQEAASPDLGADELKAVRMDLGQAQAQKEDIEKEVKTLAEELVAEEGRRAELEVLVAEEAERNTKSSVWMVSSLGVPRPLRQRKELPSTEQAGEKETPDVAGPHEDPLGSDDDDYAQDNEDDDEDAADVAVLNNPEGVCLDSKGMVYVTDTIHSSIRKIGTKRQVLKFAGTDVAGHADGPGHSAQLSHPRGLCMLDSGVPGIPYEDGSQALLVCDTENHCLRLISDEQVWTLAGCPGEAGHVDGPVLEARFNMPWAACAVDRGTAVLVCDAQNHCIRRIDNLMDLGVEHARVSTVFGNPQMPGSGLDELRFPWSVCAWGLDKAVVGDKLNQRLLMIDTKGQQPAEDLSEWWPDSLRFGARGLATDGSTVYMSNSWQSQVWALRKDADGDLRQLDRVAGTGLPDHRDGKGEFTEFFCPAGMAIDPAGTLFLADHGNHCVRKLRELQAEEVLQKLSKFMRDLKNRWVYSCFGSWRDSTQAVAPSEPLDVVLAIAMGTHKELGEESILRLLAPVQGLSGLIPLQAGAPLRRIVRHVAALLKWRIPRTRKEVTEAQEESLEEDVEDVQERLAEARKIFLQYDKDSGGTIDTGELMEALIQNDMEVTEEEVQAMIKEYATSDSGEVTFSDFCRMQGLPPPPDGYLEGQH